MKNLILVFAMSLGTVAIADQATDSIVGPITCRGKSFTVTISANRKKLTIRKDGVSKAQVYSDMEQTTGDTATDYAPAGQQAPLLSFNDQGDFIQFNSKQKGVDISCPQAGN